MSVTRDTDDQSPEPASTPIAGAPATRPTSDTVLWTALGLLVLLALAASVRLLEDNVPTLLADTALADLASSIEYPVYAIALGLLGNLALGITGARNRMALAFRTEFLIKTGLVLLGASVNLGLIVSAAGPAILQALLLISAVFLFTWWLAGRLGLDDRLRALLASAVSICGVSAAIAAAGAVQARREQLAYVSGLVILFALPSIFLLPWAAGALGLSEAVTGAWIGGNIDTTAAVSAAGAIAGEGPLQIASIVKVTQNALMGVVAVALTVYFAVRVERRPGAAAPRAGELWRRFPKFVLGFVAASVLTTTYLTWINPTTGGDVVGVANDLRDWFLILAFVSIGLEFRLDSLRSAGWRPVGVFAGATLVNLVVGLGLALLLFRGVEVG
ncbi:putative sulfate exporter family transporter [Actinoalloteichus sp. AHMU CJ021]|uniref:Membrane protein YadS n=1 Tax=Actinoalloteichus caeruleus DSM 43889 TaxID=1120930 RepID=A0ABT1JQQ7_ACTCY|nr:putative sulfate exporter family transporter [Actinoalloteichus caeruleus]AUS80324.1 putative sulfate exporter family transporter [Actinoalloteichus sp. AHMU CJ021]MCP2334579.1 putative membrane protein YadS [Actinoalloteichus caeruleus DSM 43889]